jgi:hypothetical protein
VVAPQAWTPFTMVGKETLILALLCKEAEKEESFEYSDEEFNKHPNMWIKLFWLRVFCMIS